MKPTADPKSIRHEAQLSANDVLNMMQASSISRRKSAQTAKLVKSIIRKLTLMQQQILESIWTQLSLLGRQAVMFFFHRLLDCINDDERRVVLERMQSNIVLDNGALEGSERLIQFMSIIPQVGMNQMVGLMNPRGEADIIDEDATMYIALLMNAPLGTFSAPSSSSSDEDSKTGSEHSNE